jgi:hypothetical protein
MKRWIVFFLFLLMLIPIGVQAQVNTSNQATVNGTVNSAPSQSIQQNYAAPNAGQGRWFLAPPQPYSAPVVPYLGPWNSGPNIIDDLRVFPEVITRAQALKMYKGGVTARIHKMVDYSYQFEECKLMNSLPLKPLLASDGKPVQDKDGRPIMVPDEAKFRRVAIIELQGDAEASTTDVLAKAVIEATEDGMGITGLYLVKKVTTNETVVSGWGIGFGGAAGSLTGSEKDKSQAASMGTGYNRARSTPVYKEGMVILGVQE